MKVPRSLFLVTVLSALTFSACAQNSPYRTNYQSCTYTQSSDCADHAVQHHAPGQPGEYYLSFIELDDQGQLWDRKQLRNMLETYRPIAGIDDVLLVTFIHGWHHNASPEDGNIQDFRHLLADLSQAESDNATKRKVLEVYIGWRGESLTIPVMKHITFWDRKNTAHKVGQQGVTEVLLRLEEIVNAKAAHTKHRPEMPMAWAIWWS